MGIDRVVLAWSNAAPAFIEHLLTHCRRLEVKLSVVSPFRGLARPAEKLSHVAELPVLEYNTWDVPRSTMALKRALDLAGAAIALTLLAPVFVVTAIAIKLDERGPVFYRQTRAGRHGKPFRMIKFRSMSNDAEERLAELIAIDRLDPPVFKVRADPRVTRVGRFIRRFSIDELPQLINVLRGEMSLVGPRPEELILVERYDDQDKFRFVLRPGLTGPMQVLGRGELNFGERLAVDLDYLETLSVTRDMRLIALTLPAVIRGKGAYEPCPRGGQRPRGGARRRAWRRSRRRRRCSPAVTPRRLPTAVEAVHPVVKGEVETQVPVPALSPLAWTGRPRARTRYLPAALLKAVAEVEVLHVHPVALVEAARPRSSASRRISMNAPLTASTGPPLTREAR